METLYQQAVTTATQRLDALNPKDPTHLEKAYKIIGGILEATPQKEHKEDVYNALIMDDKVLEALFPPSVCGGFGQTVRQMQTSYMRLRATMDRMQKSLEKRKEPA